jgi:nucleolar MIF4G domain-containing protein 1
VLYGLLVTLVSTLDELDATLMLSLLRCAGARLRSEDPGGMKDFILSLQTRVAELRDKTGGAEGGADTAVGGLTKRARLMLDMVVDLKNNKRVVGAGAGGAGGAEGGDQWGFPAALAKWLRASHSVGDAAVALRALTHERLIDESKHKGQWWLPEAAGTEAWFAARAAQGALDKQASSTAAAAAAQEGAELLQKAKGLRMNTEARRAIFCVVMGEFIFICVLYGQFY